MRIYRFFMVFLTLALGALTSHAETPRPTESTNSTFFYQFANGNRLGFILGQGMVFFGTDPYENVIKKTPLQLPGKIQQFFQNENPQADDIWAYVPASENSDGYGVLSRYTSAKLKFLLTETGPNIYFVNQDGLHFPLPIPKKQFELIQGRVNGKKVAIWNWAVRYFDYQGIEHAVFTMKAAQRSDGGITFVLREDGKRITVENTYLPSLKIHVSGHELILPELSYPIDLRLLDRADAKISPPGANRDVVVPDEEGARRNAGDIVHENFMDFAKEISPEDLFDPMSTDEIEQIRRVLLRKESANIVITGPAGSGKTSLLKTLVYMVKQGAFPEIPPWTEFIEITPQDMEAAAKYIGNYASRIKALISYLKAKKDVILVIDELHAMRGNGVVKGKKTDFFEFLNAALANGSIRVFGTSTEKAISRAFSGNPAIMRRFALVKKKVITDDKEIDQAMVNWSKAKGFQPLPAELRQEIRIISSEYDALGLEFNKAIRLQDQFYVDLSLKNKQPAQATIEDLYELAPKIYHLNVALFDPAKRQAFIERIRKGLNEDITGYNDLKQRMVEDVEVAFAGTGDLSKPQGRYMFVGPNGVGKTYIPEMLAKELGVPFLRVNAPEYNGRAQALLDRIGEALQENAFTVVLIDEIEKSNIQDALLALLDSPHMHINRSFDGTDDGSADVPVATSHAAIFLATNAGQQQIAEDPNISFDRLRPFMEANNVSKALLDRTQPIIFKTPNREQFLSVMKNHLQSRLSDLESRKHLSVHVKNQEQFLNTIADKYHDPRGGYRAGILEVDRVVSLAAARARNEHVVTQCSVLLESSGQPRRGKQGGIGFIKDLPPAAPPLDGQEILQ